jgi:anti-sigma B factor antagonist
MPTEGFEARVERRADGAVVVAEGEIDMATSPTLREALREPAAAEAAALVLDLRAVSFMDSSGLGIIVGQHKRARERGSRFAVAVDGAENVERILSLSGLTEVLEIVAHPEEALAG